MTLHIKNGNHVCTPPRGALVREFDFRNTLFCVIKSHERAQTLSTSKSSWISVQAAGLAALWTSNRNPRENRCWQFKLHPKFMWGVENTPQPKNKLGWIRPCWSDSDIYDPKIVSGMPPGKKRIGQIEKTIMRVYTWRWIVCASRCPPTPPPPALIFYGGGGFPEKHVF